MERSYIKDALSKFVDSFNQISKDEINCSRGSLVMFSDMLYEYVTSEISRHGFFCFNSALRYKDYEKFDETQKDWAIALNQMAIDVFSKAFDEMMEDGKDIVISIDKNNAEIYVNFGLDQSKKYKFKKDELSTFEL